MTPAMNCPTCNAEFTGHAQGITFYACEGKASFGMKGLEYICEAKKVKHLLSIKGNVALIICEACNKKHFIAENCCIKIQCPCGNQIKTCSS